ncbi:hypothetical protein [Stenotrophomonas maltophilia]|uniref:hypothetical protein n=2 Tax=Stenotrophomonas maltophilia TaxID=40324 RepID=UPI000ADD894E|nr:hypothetical protein [Stenotrophomonas maltophilia]MBN5038822.1 hypothetical protein [Stenotrophomonas maltophilia]MBN5056034.1 hypothetical protein [Stenotrophomonas maltophilia]HDX0837700.1 hypothetical protein [Stenotrophomonas maltophilia]HEL4117314.1 hypothetical protein [Stenotrophomonas maltophilia]HEL5330891.1 hypothetical protein [Stenotrophomonas maltophilia]
MPSLPKNSLAPNIEKFLSDAIANNANEVSTPISLYLGGGLGCAPQAAQAIARISRNSATGLTFKTAREFLSLESTADRLSSTLHGMACLYFADSVQSGDITIPRRQALRSLIPRVNAMNTEAFENTTRGQGVTLCCFSGARLEFLSPLYSKTESRAVRTEAEFELIIRRITKRLGRTAATSMVDGQYVYLSKLIHQLFLNSDEHGSFDLGGQPLPTSIRGINIRVTALGRIEEVVNEAKGDSALQTYLAGSILSNEFPSSDNPTLLELTVFDTGVGMGLNWLAKRSNASSYSDFTRDEEAAAVETCFKKHATTKANHVSGQGLPIVLRSLRNLGAFMTLRTGRVSLYQDFNKKNIDQFNPTPRFKNVELEETSGTSFTIWFRIK